MAVLRRKLKENFTIISNDIFKDKRLSMKGRGLLCTLLSLPDGWEFTEKGIEALFPDGQFATRSAIKELTELGYLKRERIRGEGGKLGICEWTISDHPMTEKEHIEPKKDSNLAAPNLENHNLVKQPQLRTKELRTNESSTEGMGELTNSAAQESFEESLSRASDYELTTATEEDVSKITMAVLSKVDTDKPVDLKMQKLFSREPLDRIMHSSSATAEEVITTLDRMMDMRPGLRSKLPSYLFRDCEGEILLAIEASRENGVSWSKW